MKLNLTIKCFLPIILLFIYQTANSIIIINDDIVMDVPKQWIYVSSDEVRKAAENLKEYGINDNFSKSLIGQWEFNKSQNWDRVSNVKIFRYSNKGDTLYRNYLIREYRNLCRQFLNEMSEQINQLSNFSVSIENQKFHFNTNRDMVTADFKSTINFYSGTTVDSISYDGLLVYIHTQSYMYYLDAVFYYDSSYEQNKVEFENFLSRIEISEDSKIKDDKDNLFQRIQTRLKQIYHFSKSEDGKEILLWFIIVLFAIAFFQAMSKRNPNNLLYKYSFKILNIFLKIILRSLFWQTYNTQSSESIEFDQTNEMNKQQREVYISDDIGDIEFDDKLSDNVINDDLLSDNYKSNDDYISTSSEFDDSISNQEFDDFLSEEFNLDNSEIIKN